ncbi:unnamed protein product [Peniophora sp. CBMAI 1063]|nr:unnamed protein product [Peniophora sp. CBMAI 1063]
MFENGWTERIWYFCVCFSACEGASSECSHTSLTFSLAAPHHGVRRYVHPVVLKHARTSKYTTRGLLCVDHTLDERPATCLLGVRTPPLGVPMISAAMHVSLRRKVQWQPGDRTSFDVFRRDYLASIFVLAFVGRLRSPKLNTNDFARP